jgi:hypothetical protein
VNPLQADIAWALEGVHEVREVLVLEAGAPDFDVIVSLAPYNPKTLVHAHYRVVSSAGQEMHGP